MGGGRIISDYYLGIFARKALRPSAVNFNSSLAPTPRLSIQPFATIFFNR
jgi:hypothetical protein